MPFLPVLPKYLLNNMFIIITFNLYLFIIFFGQKCLDYWTRWLFYYSLSILIFLFKCFKICPSAVISGKKCDLLFYSGLGYNNIFFDCIGFVICSIDISFQVLIFLNKEIFNEVYLRFVFNKQKFIKIYTMVSCFIANLLKFMILMLWNFLDIRAHLFDV